MATLEQRINALEASIKLTGDEIDEETIALAERMAKRLEDQAATLPPDTRTPAEVEAAHAAFLTVLRAFSDEEKAVAVRPGRY